MRFVQENKINRLPQEPTARFFIQLWYDMVHRNSLDSHRVRCMDAISILRELQTLISKTALSGIGKDIKRVAEEVLYTLDPDPIILSQFPTS